MASISDMSTLISASLAIVAFPLKPASMRIFVLSVPKNMLFPFEPEASGQNPFIIHPWLWTFLLSYSVHKSMAVVHIVHLSMAVVYYL
jgi:hypothetical protein